MSWQETCLQEATALADRIGASAVFYQGRCNWPTRRVLYTSDSGGLDQLPRLMVLNPSVYSGTAGLAILYARLWKKTGDANHLRLARGAMEHATRHAIYVNDLPLGNLGSTFRYGAYLGTMGIAWAAHEVGTLLESDHFLSESRRLVSWLASNTNEPLDDDLMGGTAGGILCLRSLSGSVPGADALADELGRILLSRAVTGPHGVSWGRRQASGGRNLGGYSHGTSGIALALAHRWRDTGDERYRQALDGALAYDDSAFDPERSNWANFQSGPDANGRYPAMRTWCHGAPGIGLGRAHTDRALGGGSERLREDVRRAARTTADSLADNLRQPGHDYMACHGVGGLIECLWDQKDHLDPGSGQDAAAKALRLGIRQHGAEAIARWGPSAEWPTPVTNGLYPPLVTGAGGIAHLLLRMSDPKGVPTMLVPGLLTPR